jgi:hypothetical protein
MLFETLLFIGSIWCGYASNYVMGAVGIYHGKKGVAYYAEVHTKRQNIVVHVIGMPFTIYGMTLWIPATAEALFDFDPYLTQYALFLYYLGLYSYISLDDCVYYCFMYFPTILLGRTTYVGGLYDVLMGLGISTAALVFQEIVGHKMGGDPASRPEGVLNAIFYAKYFSASSLKRILRYRL